MTKKNEWQSIADDIDVESNTENQIKDININKENIEQDNKYRDKEKDSEYSWDRI